MIGDYGVVSLILDRYLEQRLHISFSSFFAPDVPSLRCRGHSGETVSLAEGYGARAPSMEFVVNDLAMTW